MTGRECTDHRWDPEGCFGPVYRWHVSGYARMMCVGHIIESELDDAMQEPYAIGDGGWSGCGHSASMFAAAGRDRMIKIWPLRDLTDAEIARLDGDD